MSSLYFEVTEERAIVATDTLVARSGDLMPIAFATKVFALPHVRALMACTGWMQFAHEWLFRLNGQFVAPNVDVLNTYAPAVLREIWGGGYQNLDGTTTIYHFIADAGRMRTFAFRSTANFNVEELPGECRAYKPPFEGHGDHPMKDIEDIAAAMNKQRAEQATKPTYQRVAIGGEMNVAVLSANGHLELWPAYRFDDYDIQLKQMTDALLANRK